MIQGLFHLWGDYITQNHWMASKKVLFTEEGWFACAIHCVLYSIPFLFIASVDAFMIILITHFLIDKFRLAKYIVQLRNWCFTDTGAPASQPPFLAIWLLIIADNTIHLTINYLSIKYL